VTRALIRTVAQSPLKVLSALKRESVLVTAAFLLGAAAVPAGVGMIYLPAGLIVGGLLDLSFVLLYVRGTAASAAAKDAAAAARAAEATE
jgi:hypothetical protein